VARPRRHRRCRRHRTVADGNIKSALGGGAAVTRRVAGGCDNNGVVVGGVGRCGRERGASVLMWGGDVGQVVSVAWRSGADGSGAGGPCCGAGGPCFGTAAAASPRAP